MLEFNYNSLDDEFVTFWSRHLTNAEETDMLGKLEKLAEKGQINAIQNWYLYKEVGENKKIDKIVESMSGENFNELFAMANYFFMRKDLYEKFCALTEEYDALYEAICGFKDDDEIDIMESEYTEEYEEVEGFDLEESYNVNMQYEEDDKYEALSIEEMEQKFEEVRNEILNMPHVKLLKKAYSEAIKCFKKTNNILVFSTANEILDCLPQTIPVYEDTDEIEMKVQKQNKIIWNHLLMEYRNNVQDNPQFSPADNPALAFSLAKTILAFHEGDKDANFAHGLLELLADRSCETIDNFDFEGSEAKWSF